MSFIDDKAKEGLALVREVQKVGMYPHFRPFDGIIARHGTRGREPLRQATRAGIFQHGDLVVLDLALVEVRPTDGDPAID